MEMEDQDNINAPPQGEQMDMEGEDYGEEEASP